MFQGSDNKSLYTYTFFVEIDGIETARFQKCEGLEAETSVIEVEEGGGEVLHFRGRTRYPNIVLEKGVSENNELYDWYKQTLLDDGKIERKNGSVVLRNLQGEEVKRWNFFRAIPCRWLGPALEANMGSEYAIERVEIAHELLEIDGAFAGDDPAEKFRIGQDMSEEKNFATKVSMTSDKKIGPIVGYPETGSTSWRAANDEVFIKACENYNNKYGYGPRDGGYMSPRRMKAWAMMESGGSGDKDAFLTDPFQVNVGDWDDAKIRICGITEGQKMTPETSAAAALEWWRYKGFIHDDYGRETEWEGDMKAFRDYNGHDLLTDACIKEGYDDPKRDKHKYYYADKIIKMDIQSEKWQ